MVDNIKQQIIEIIKSNEKKIDNKDYQAAINYILNNKHYKLAYISAFIAIMKQAGCNIQLDDEFNIVLNDLLNNYHILTQKPFEIVSSKNIEQLYPTAYWNDLLRNEIPKITSFLEKILHIEINSDVLNKLNNIKIVFSSKEITKNYGKYNNNDIVRTITDYLQKNSNTSSSIKSTLEYVVDYFKRDKEVNTEEVKHIIKNLIKEHKNQLTKQELRGLEKILDSINKYSFTTKTLGEFNPNFTITLYVETIFDQTINPYVSFKNALIEVFAHELFHAFHFAMLDDKNKWKNCNNIIIESFAAYFEYLYSRNQDIYVFDLEKDWRKYDMYTYPYSGARFLKDNVFQSTKSQLLKHCTFFNFDHLFHLALINAECALKVFELYYLYDNT